MRDEELRQRTEALRSRAAPEVLEEAVLTLWQQGEDVGGGVNADRLVRYLLEDPHLRDEDVVWAYDRLKPAFRATFEENPYFYYFEGD